MVNKTGAASVKGTLLATDDTTENGVRIPVSPFDIAAVMYEDGKADGQRVKVVTSGLVEVLLENGTTAGMAGWVRASSDAYGRAVNTTDPAGLGAIATADHFKEIGHSVQSVAAGTDKLCKIIFHQL